MGKMRSILPEGVSEISLDEFQNVKIGHAQDYEAMTGVTAILFVGKAVAGVDISGGGPASRETPLLDPEKACENINAVILSGGSAFGLEAGCGASEYLEEHGIGYDTGYAKVPLVCQSCIYDLSIGRSDVRPDKAMGYKACEAAQTGNGACGSIGAGTGATVGKLAGMKRSMKSGLGVCCLQSGELKMAAVVAVNALGDVFRYDSREKIAGMLDEKRTEFGDTEAEMMKGAAAGFSGEEAVNTTISCIITNGDFSKADMNKIASMSRNAYSRCISPVGTTADGDTIYAVSAGDVKDDINRAGVLASRALGMAIERAIEESHIDDDTYTAMCL